MVHTGMIQNNNKVILDGMVLNISPMNKEQAVGAIDAYYIKSHGYCIVKLLSLPYKMNERTIVYGQIFNE